jgi:outer membrane protein OmpA-like peptidoglycan-associated protein
VDASGCPIPQDADGDGVVDAKDKCPDTPRGVPVREDGCPPEGLEQVAGEWVIRGRLLFDTNKSTLKPEATEILDRVVDFMKKQPQWTVEIQGHTDNTGSLGYNMSLSQKRADAVRDYLVKGGVPASRLSTKGFGPNEPMESNDTPEGRAANRRVDFKPTEH